MTLEKIRGQFNGGDFIALRKFRDTQSESKLAANGLKPQNHTHKPSCPGG